MPISAGKQLYPIGFIGIFGLNIKEEAQKPKITFLVYKYFTFNTQSPYIQLKNYFL